MALVDVQKYEPAHGQNGYRGLRQVKRIYSPALGGWTSVVQREHTEMRNEKRDDVCNEEYHYH